MFLNFFLQPKLKKVNIASTTYLLLSCFSLQAMDNLEEADENVTRKDQIQIFVKKESQDLVSSNIESRVGGIITNFEDIEGDIEKSLQNQTFLLGQTFEEKVKAEEDKKKHLIDETESGIKQKSSSIAAIKGKIIQQTRGISEEIRKISLFIDNLFFVKSCKYFSNTGCVV